MRFLVLFLLITLNSCNDEVVVKPNAMLRLEYDKPSYEPIDTDCPYNFLKNKDAILQKKKNCWMNIYYPKMKATLYLSYREINER